jgi:hypothetical protein
MFVREELEMGRIIAIVTLLAFSSLGMVGQVPQSAENSKAYLMLATRKVAAETELKDTLAHFTSNHPLATAKRYELDFLKAAMMRMSATEGVDISKLDAGYARLILRSVALETELRVMHDRFTADFPDLIDKKIELAANERLIGYYSAAHQ